MPQQITNDSHRAFCKVLWNVPDPISLNMCIQLVPYNLFYTSVSLLPIDVLSVMTAWTVERAGTNLRQLS